MLNFQHLATSEMGFGGMGESIKSIVDKKTWMDLPMRYQPYNRELSMVSYCESF